MSIRFKPKFNIKKGDTVVVITGEDKDLKKPRKVLEIISEKNRVLVEGVNIVTKHTKPTSQNTKGGIVKIEAPIAISNVMLWDAKVFGHYITINYRESYGMFACSGILHNHESSRRGEEFVTKKISLAVAKIKKGLQKKLYLGNLEAKRDWGYAKDYVEAMWMMLQQETPNDYVVGTGETYSVREFCDEAFSYVGLDYKNYVVEDKKLFRPAEVDILLADIKETIVKLKWKPKTQFKDLVRLMVDHDLYSYTK